MFAETLEFTEEVVFKLRSLFDQHGYTRYKMGKFEEYDLYARNKDFLISDGVITFTDTNGKLMALKPDVTLSIVKNSKDVSDTVQKLYYNENVYRVTGSSHTFKEIMQVGLECLGNIDDYCISEVLMLAAESLNRIAGNTVLDISHVGFLAEVMMRMGIPKEDMSQLLRYIAQKNQHELSTICSAIGVSQENIALLKTLTSMRAEPQQILPELKKRFPESKSLIQLQRVCAVLESSPTKVFIDFSVGDDMRYYNGIVFKGFVEGVAASVLSGGQYDALMNSFKRKSGAIGFAIYMDLLERMGESSGQYDVDVLLVYGSNTSVMDVNAQMQKLIAEGKTVMAQPAVPENIRYRQLITIGVSKE